MSPADTTAQPPARRSTTVEERRLRAVDAFIDLVLAEQTPPTPELVAERAGVSPATLYRYFATLDELRREATARILDRYPHLFAIPDIGTGPLAERIERFVDTRVELHETIHPLALLLRTTVVADSGAAELVDAGRQAMADQIRLHFDAELGPRTPARREDVVTAIASLTSVESWQQFRHSHRRSPSQTRRAWADALDQILTSR